MSELRQRPEHLIIRDYVQALRDEKRITQEGLRDAFVPVYLEMIPPGEDVPTFEAVHRHDTVDQARKKDQANLKKLWRALDGGTFFPLVFREPLIAALEKVGKGLGVELRKLLLHNAGLLHLPIDTSGRAPALYETWLREFAEANTAMVADISRNQVLDSDRTRKEILDTIESGLAVLRSIEENQHG